MGSVWIKITGGYLLNYKHRAKVIGTVFFLFIRLYLNKNYFLFLGGNYRTTTCITCTAGPAIAFNT